MICLQGSSNRKHQDDFIKWVLVGKNLVQTPDRFILKIKKQN